MVDKGPVQWEAALPGTVRTMEAEKMVAQLGFKEGHLEQVTGQLTGGQVKAQAVEIEKSWIRWSAPVTFTRDDGWHGDATGGRAPRPPEGGAFQQVDFTNFRAMRAIPGGTESVTAEGARWTPAGLRLEGNVRLEQPLDGKKLLLQAPRVLQRTAPGDDLPAELPDRGELGRIRSGAFLGHPDPEQPAHRRPAEDPAVAHPGARPGPGREAPPSAPGKGGATPPGGCSTVPSWPISARAPPARGTTWCGRTTATP